MLVLDEQLLGRHLEAALGRWYRGPVRFITELRPGSVIKDAAIPALLRQQHHATFLTIHEPDCWRKVVIDAHVCVVCFALPDSRTAEISDWLRTVFRLPAFRTKARRMGRSCGSLTEQSATTRIGSGRYEQCHCEAVPHRSCAAQQGHGADAQERAAHAQR